jgi:Williams-Beuren syndrome DDT (WSD), D-TOX E motif
MDIDEASDIPEIKQITYQWYYYDEEDEFNKLIESCNLKGIRERRL